MRWHSTKGQGWVLVPLTSTVLVILNSLERLWRMAMSSVAILRDSPAPYGLVMVRVPTLAKNATLIKARDEIG